MARNEMARERGGNVPVRGAGALGALRGEMNRLFDRFYGGRTQDMVEDVRPHMDPFEGFGWPFGRGESVLGQTDLSETDEAYELEVDLPGLKRDDVQVDYSSGMLTISGERADEHEDQRRGYYLSERSYGSFRRSFRVPENVESERIEARFRDGVLTVRLPKSEDAQRSARRIEISES